MYGNVLALMAIFAAIFSLVNVNLSGIMAQTPVTQTIVINLVTVGSFAILAALIMAVVKPKGLSAKVVPWVVALLAFSVAIAVAWPRSRCNHTTGLLTPAWRISQGYPPRGRIAV